jgi:hypothetical protein
VERDAIDQHHPQQRSAAAVLGPVSEVEVSGEMLSAWDEVT